MDIPTLGFGTYRIAKQDCATAICEAIRVGYRHLDCASFYENQESVGTAFKQALEKYNLKRDDFFITSKIWPTEMGNIEQALRKTLAQLQLDHLDLYLVHWPLAFDDAKNEIPMHHVWREMERMQKLGLTRKIGVSNFSVPMILDILSYCDVKPYCNQIEVNVYEARSCLIDYCMKIGVNIVSYRPIGASLDELQTDTRLSQIVTSKKCTIPQLVCKYFHQKYGIIILAKSVRSDRIEENFACLDIPELSHEELEYLDSFNGRKPKSADGIAVWGFNVFE